MGLVYGDDNQDHAVTAMGANSYTYDSNGSQVTRTIAGATLTLSYDAENHMVGVNGTGMAASFVYNGDGQRVKSIINGVTTYFVWNYYEVSGSTVSKNYFIGGARVATRQAGVLYYPLTDHLGSTTVITDAAGTVVSELRYNPWGETRFSSGSTPTKYQFTGQYSNFADFGLYYFNARWYDPELSHFVQADTIVPPGVQGLDRYAFVVNNPLKYSDPTGHMQECAKDDEGGGCGKGPSVEQMQEAFVKYGRWNGLFSEYYVSLHFARESIFDYHMHPVKNPNDRNDPNIQYYDVMDSSISQGRNDLKRALARVPQGEITPGMERYPRTLGGGPITSDEFTLGSEEGPSAYAIDPTDPFMLQFEPTPTPTPRIMDDWWRDK